MLSNRGIKVRSCHALLTKNEGTTKNIGVLNGERPKQSNYTKIAAVGVLYTIMHTIWWRKEIFYSCLNGGPIMHLQ